MHTRTRLGLLPAALVVSAVALAGCGGGSSSDNASTGSGAGLSSVSVTGDVGKSATVKFGGELHETTTTTKVLTQGDGAAVKQGDSVILQTVIADGLTQKTVADSYADHQPQVVSLNPQVQPIFLKAFQGQKIGSRVMISTPADTIFGTSGNPQLGIGNKDTVLIVFDLLGEPVAKPNGKRHPAPAWAPTIQRTKGVISGLDFSKAPKPDGSLRSAVLSTGTGATVQKGQTIFARYLGEVYGGTKPFDQNFDGQAPATFQIGAGKVIAGWDKTLVGQKVGSEVLLAIPPKDGYGKQGSPSAGIKGTDTLYFVVDIVGAA